MGQPVVIPKFDLPGNKPHWAVRAAWMTTGVLLVSILGLAAVVMHRRSLETKAEIAKAEAIAKAKADAEAVVAKAKAEAEARVAAAAAAARAAKEAEIRAKEAKLAAKAAAEAEITGVKLAKLGGKTGKRGHGRTLHGGKGSSGKVAEKAGDGKTRVSEASSHKRGDAVIDDILSKMK